MTPHTTMTAMYFATFLALAMRLLVVFWTNRSLDFQQSESAAIDIAPVLPVVVPLPRENGTLILQALLLPSIGEEYSPPRDLKW
jgi:hypothetical protein